MKLQDVSRPSFPVTGTAIDEDVDGSSSTQTAILKVVDDDDVDDASLFVALRSLADIIDAFAIIDLINATGNAITQDEMLRVTHVLTNAHHEHALLFRTKDTSAAFPKDRIEHDLAAVFRNTTSAAFRVVRGDPDPSVRAYKVDQSHLDQARACAGTYAASLLGDAVDASLPVFTDSIASRFKFFIRIKLQLDNTQSIESAISPRHHLMQEFPPLPRGKPIAPFQKPVFDSVDELVQRAFVTWTTDMQGRPYADKACMIFCPAQA